VYACGCANSKQQAQAAARTVSQDLGNEARAVHGGVAVLRARDALQLAQRLARVRGVGGQQVERANALGVQPQVLAVALRHQQLQPARREQPRRRGVRLQVARGEALVGHIEEGQQAARDAHVRDGGPLRRRGVHARGVVRAAVQHQHAALRRRADVRHQA
jgi:hypothetical protein